MSEAFYDFGRDPWEPVNLANDPSHAPARAHMASLLPAGWQAALPSLVPSRSHSTYP